MKDNKGSDNKVQFMPLGMSIGISIGVAIGAALDNIPLYMCVGLSIGLCIGAVIDAKNRKTDGDDSSGDSEEK